MEFPFNDPNQKQVYLDALNQNIPCVTEESREFIAIITAELYKIMAKDHLLQEEVFRYRVLMDLLKQRAMFIDNERKHAERLLKQQIAVRKQKMLTDDDVQDIITKITTIFLKFIPQDKQLSVINELRTVKDYVSYTGERDNL